MAIALDRTYPVARAELIGAEVAAPAASDVDRRARFPEEAVNALREQRLLSILVPVALGGEAASLSDVAAAVTVLSRHCAATGMIYAMHQIQVACLVHHGTSPLHRGFLLEEVVAKQALLASATTEIGTGGDVRSSICAVEEADGRFHLEKKAPVISYGEHADAVLATARRSPDSPPSDQVLVLCRRPGLHLEQVSDWDTIGMRGTCSPGFALRAEDVAEAVLPQPYGDISSQTMLPVSHILWSAVWLGIAEAAVGRARSFVRAEAHRQPGVTPPGAVRLAELMTVFEQMGALVRSEAGRYDSLRGDPDALSSMDFALAMNGLKVSASTLVVEIVSRALMICGIAGYRDDSTFGLGRMLRDAYGAALMVNNDRILANSAQMLLVLREA